MTEAEFNRSVHQTRPILEELGILSPPMRLQLLPSPAFLEAAHDASRSYSDVFRTGLEHRDYCFLLRDLSYIQLIYQRGRRRGWSVRYGYYPNPYDYLTLESFLDEFGLVGSDPEAMEFYHQYMSEQSPADGIAPFRYEVDFDAHRPLRHPCAHLHVGRNTPIRLALNKAIKPKAFVLYMAKLHFPVDWAARDDAEGVPNYFDQQLGEAKAGCDSLGDEHFTAIEQGELFVT